MRNVDPRVKLLSILFTTSLALIFSDLRFMIALTLLSLLLCYALGGSIKMLCGRTKKLIPLLIAVSLIQVIFVRSGAVLLKISDYSLIYSDGLLRGANMALRFLVIFASAAVMAGENSRYVIASLSKLKLPYVFSFMLMITLRFIPFFVESFSDALVSIQLRGIELEKVPVSKKIRLYGNLLMPVVADAVVKSQDLSLAMEARGFGAMKRRTAYIEPVLTGRDIAIMLVLSVLFAASLGIYFIN